MKSGLMWTLVGVGIGVGGFMAYQQFQNGNIQRALGKMKNNQSQNQNKLGNMM